jgi:uncharacterized phage protein (TIGR02218 family)
VKTFDAGLAAHYALPNTTLAPFLEIERRDGVFLRATGAMRDVEVDGEVYLAAKGLDLSQLDSSAGTSVDKLELTIFPDDDVPEVDLLAGRYDFARYRLFETSYVDPTIGINLLRRGWLGNVEARRGAYVVELRSLKQTLQQAVGAVTSKTCRYRFGSSAMPLGLCMIDAAAYTFTYAVTAVASRREFTCSAAAEAADFYKEGTAESLDAANEGYSQKVKAFAGGVFTLALPMPFDIGVGDEFSFVAGCQKRLAEDCRDKFDNVLNFGGEPHVPGPDVLTGDPDLTGT